MLVPYSEFLYNVQSGKVNGHSADWKFGAVSGVTNVNPSDIWDNGGDYTFLSADTTLYLSSSDNTDNHTIAIYGLDSNWDFKYSEIDLTGQTQVSAGNWLRISGMTNANGAATAGDVYLAESDTLTDGVPNTSSKIKAKFTITSQQTKMAIVSVPRNHTCFIFSGYSSVGKGKDSNVALFKRRFGGEFTQLGTTGLYQNNAVIDFPFIPISEKSDIKMRATTADASGVDVYGSFGYMFVHNDLIESTYTPRNAL